VKTEFGWHAVLVTGEVPPRNVKFEDVRDEVEKRYRSDLHREAIRKAELGNVN
jgi:parvulin-like peptidyl-prolyl isomerase